jgi:hypothetical protein
MKGKVKFAVAAVLMAVFVAAFAAEALAYPSWITVKYTGSTLRYVKNKKVSDGNYLCLVHKFDIINNSKKGDILTAIYNRNISWNGELNLTKLYADPFKVKYAMKGTSPYKGEWYPGQTYKYEHSVPLNSLIKPIRDWKFTNEAAAKGCNFKMGRWKLDFQVASKN